MSLLTSLSSPVAIVIMAIVIVVLVIALIILLVMMTKLNKKVDGFLVGIDSKNIKDSMGSLDASVEDLADFRKELEAYLETVERRLKRSVQSVHTVRFNPFKGSGSGGNQSFATALLTEDGDGVILSSLYSREHVSIFSKPIKGHTPEFDLSAEEKEVLEKAKEALK